MPTYDHGAAGLTGTIGVTILNADGTAHTARATAGITEPVAGSGVYHVAHPAAGTLLLFVFDGGVGTVGASVWDDGLVTAAPPAGYTRISSVTYGTLLPGTVIDAYAVADTDYATPLVPNVTSASNGSWHIDLPDGATYTLVGRLTGKRDAIQEVTVA